MNKWIAEFELEDGDTMPEHMDLNYMGGKIDFHCRPLWISCSERLPEEDTYVLITIEWEDGSTEIGIDSIVDGKWILSILDDGDTVTAWMPLPESYKGD